ncbi:FAD binding domain protein [Whalleya microplaca]|nr:FAD binding domain protein [Whalleya microplaca]
MEVVTAIAAWAISAACRNVPTNSLLAGICNRGVDIKELSGRLSTGARVYGPGTDVFTQATTRWSTLDAPGVDVVVVPSVENDVAETVKYGNEKNIPYLPVNGGHGAIITVGKMQGGIQIWMDDLNTVEIADDGKSAKIGGGTLSKTITDTLWAAGKQTSTGACECTSILGPGLGGGHGFHQGRYGLVADQFLSMNIVLADGSLQTIDETSDLWWAMKGAGHNFGIVTSVTSKIYDIENPNWAYVSFTFTGDKIEGLYQATKDYLLKNGTQPVEVINYSFFINLPEVDPDNTVVLFFILQGGVQVVDPVFTDPFVKLGPVATTSSAGTYRNLAAWTGNGNADAPCQKVGLVNTRFPIDVETYDIQAQRKVYDLFSSATHETPALNGSLFLFEGYSLQAVQAIPKESTAVSYRGDNLLFAPLIIYSPGGDELEKQAAKLGEDLRQILYEATGREEKHTYVNYAFGTETKEQMYGYEQWRQDKLLNLKNKYDPDRKFSFYAPIA